MVNKPGGPGSPPRPNVGARAKNALFSRPTRSCSPFDCVQWSSAMFKHTKAAVAFTTRGREIGRTEPWRSASAPVKTGHQECCFSSIRNIVPAHPGPSESWRGALAGHQVGLDHLSRARLSAVSDFAGWTGTQGVGQPVSCAADGIEDTFFLRGEVAKEGAARDLGRGGQIVDRHLVEAVATDQVETRPGTAQP